MPKQPSEFDRGVQFVREHFPKLKIRYKNENWFSKFLGVIAYLFNPKYMTEFTTVRGGDVYFPSRAYVEEAPRRAFKILMHEFVHLWDKRVDGFWKHFFGYAFPQIMAAIFIPLLILALFIPGGDPGTVKWVTVGVLAFLSVLSLFPLPSPGRTRIELRGYAMSMALNFWRYGGILDKTKEMVADQFTGWSYYRMWPFKADIDHRIETAAILIGQETILSLDYEGGGAGPFALVKDLREQMD